MTPLCTCQHHTAELRERIGRRDARIEVLEWAMSQPPTIHTERLLRFIRETESLDPSTAR